MVILLEEALVAVEVHLFETWHEFPQKLGWFVREELNTLSQVNKGLLGNLAFQSNR